jgi:hypothetical protein
LIEIPINDRNRAIGIGIVIGKYCDDDNPGAAWLVEERGREGAGRVIIALDS